MKKYIIFLIVLLVLIILSLVVYFVLQKKAQNDKNLSIGLETEVIKYIPTVIPSEKKEGYCWVNSLSVSRKGAWRCTVDSSISDPCFVINGSQDLVCDENPVTGDGGFVLKLTKPLPEDMGTDNFTSGCGWLIQLENGVTCGFNTGATGVINNERINYSCSDGSFIIGDLEIGNLWKANKVNDLQTKLIESVSIKKVWQ